MVIKLKYWIPVVLWAGVIFFFSSIQIGGASQFYWKDFVIKKTAHLIEYAILAILLYRAIISSGVKPKNAFLYAFFISIFYAITDEVHQIFTPGRGATVRDVVIDAIGAWIGLKIYILQKHVD